MPIPQNKKELIEAIKVNYAKLKKDLDEIPTDFSTKKDLEGHAKGTKMSVADLVAYLIGWGELVLKWYEKKEKGEKVDFPETGYHWNELGLLAQKFYKDYENLNYSELLKQLDQLVYRILALIELQSDIDLYQKPFYKNHTHIKHPLSNIMCFKH